MHDPLDTIDLSELHQGLKVRLPLTLSIGSEGFHGDVEPDLVLVLKAVGDGLLGRIDLHRYVVDFDHIDPGTKRWFGIPEDTEGDAVYFRNLSMAGQSNVDLTSPPIRRALFRRAAR